MGFEFGLSEIPVRMCISQLFTGNYSAGGTKLQYQEQLIPSYKSLKSLDQSDGNENSMFRHPLGFLEHNFSRQHCCIT